MKRFSGFWLVTLFLAGCLNTTDKNSGSSTAPTALVKEDSSTFTSIQWLDSSKDLGKVKEGQLVDVSFRFRNTGNKPLVIRSVRASCGCTTPAPPDKPFAPGEEGEIKATFNSKGRVGMNHKEIYVQANTHGTQNHELSFDVDVQKDSD